MKKITKICLTVVLFLSLAFNVFMAYYFYSTEKSSGSIVKLDFADHNIKIYCERAEDVETTEIDCTEGSFKIGNAEFISGEELYLRTPGKEINLSRTDSDAFVVNSEGEILYQFVKTEKISDEKSVCNTVRKKVS